MFWFRPKGDPILLRLCLALILWFRPKGDPIFFACPKKMGEKKGHPERLLFLIPVRFSGRQKNRFFEQARKINTFFA
ncbi:hypothetical protein IO43_09810 [Gallibacterium anatis 7990]|nr:hypothetical protein IO43_09810 [Gallibacterium anatis 7990]